MNPYGVRANFYFSPGDDQGYHNLSHWDKNRSKLCLTTLEKGIILNNAVEIVCLVSI